MATSSRWHKPAGIPSASGESRHCSSLPDAVPLKFEDHEVDPFQWRSHFWLRANV